MASSTFLSARAGATASVQAASAAATVFIEELMVATSSLSPSSIIARARGPSRRPVGVSLGWYTLLVPRFIPAVDPRPPEVEEDDATFDLPVVSSVRHRRPARLPEGRRGGPQRPLPPVRHLRALRLRGLSPGLRHPLQLRLHLPRLRTRLRHPAAAPRPLTLAQRRCIVALKTCARKMTVIRYTCSGPIFQAA